MGIQAFTDCCVKRRQSDRDEPPHTVAAIVDFLIGPALITIGLLGLYGVIPSMSSIVSYSLIATGATYGFVTYARCCANVKLTYEDQNKNNNYGRAISQTIKKIKEGSIEEDKGSIDGNDKTLAEEEGESTDKEGDDN